MKVLFLLLTICCNSSVMTHDVPLAIFHISEINDVVQIKISMDLADFQESGIVEISEVNIENMQNYFDEHTRFLFNAKSTDLKLTHVEIVGDHIKINGSFGKLGKEITTLKIINTCLTNISGHSNIIQVDLNDKSKDYRMHKGRTEIALNYTN